MRILLPALIVFLFMPTTIFTEGDTLNWPPNKKIVIHTSNEKNISNGIG